MSRRPLLTLLSALALVLFAAPASFAAAPAAAPAAHAATDDDSICADGELAVESDDGTVECTGEDDEVADDGAGDDVDALCDDDWSEDSSDDWGDDDSDDAEIATADDCDDTLAAPVLTKLGAKIGRGRGAKVTVSFTLDLPGEVALTLQRSESGTTSGKRCVATAAKHGAKGKAAKGKGGKEGKRCSRTVPLGGTAYVDGDEGANSFVVAKWKARSLKPGSYKLSATPTDDGGQTVTATFAVAAR